MSEWTKINENSEVKFCDMVFCDNEAVGYAIATDGTKFCLCEGCRAAFYLGAEVAKIYGVPDFFRLEEGGDE